MAALAPPYVGYDCNCWDGVDRKYTVEDINAHAGMQLGSTNRGDFVYIDGERVRVYVRHIDGVSYAISADAAYARQWDWIDA